MKSLLRTAFRSIGLDVRRVGGPGKAGSSHDPYAVMQSLVTAPNPVIFDVGAHIGETARHFRSLFPDATLHCFEPFPDSYAKLSVATASDARVFPHAVALSDKTGTAHLKSNTGSATNSLLATDPKAAEYWGSGSLETRNEVEVRTQTIDDFCAGAGIARIDILKLDVQGAEFSVLTGSRGLLEQRAIGLVFMEMIMAPTYVGQRKLHEYLAMFDSLGYALLDLYTPLHSGNRLIQCDAIVVSQDLLR